MDFENKVRFFHFFISILINQQRDPLCNKCRALTNSYNEIRALIEETPPFNDNEELVLLFEKTNEMMQSINAQADLPGQKREGNCKMPKGICFIKSPKKIIESISLLSRKILIMKEEGIKPNKQIMTPYKERLYGL